MLFFGVFILTDKYKLQDDVSSPSRNPFTITPSDSTELTVIPKGIYVGTGGTVVLLGDTATANATFVNVQSGQIIPVRVRKVFATGTTATNLVGLA